MQQTIAGRAVVQGFGYWSGRDVRVEFRPAAAGSGVTFVRSDLGSQARAPARVEWRVEAPRRSNLRFGRVEVDMVEHVMAALAGLNIDNCEVWVDQPEMPGCDGSAAAFVDALLRVGIVQQGTEAVCLRVSEPVRVTEGDCWIEARPSAKGEFQIEYQLDYPRCRTIGRQVARIVLTPDRFRSELAPCRTFVLQSEADALKEQGLGRRVTSRDLLVFSDDGPIDNRLRFPNECARHKALDVLGDLALAGRRIVGEITAHRSGHRLHAELTKALVERFATSPLRASA
ncbi:MAG: UDP-3-O-[3-hydroxymyristoyl] N-acetylglucosamine deacetylase [Planctomycetota bacterium]|nr:MAG: UDP-3-O-[3-hydroxymyristoyl] N-acetylglucosamine deacetylase [Planctomycetota bacterium]